MSSLNRLLFAMLSLHECDPAVVGAFRWTPAFFCSREAHIVRISSASAAVFLILGSGGS